MKKRLHHQRNEYKSENCLRAVDGWVGESESEWASSSSFSVSWRKSKATAIHTTIEQKGPPKEKKKEKRKKKVDDTKMEEEEE